MARGGLGFLVFWRNQMKLREEIRGPRLIFAFSAPPLILLFHSLAIAWLWPEIIQKKISLEEADRTASILLIIVFAVLYAGVVRAAVRWPARTTFISLWFYAVLGAVGVTAKFLKVFVQR